MTLKQCLDLSAQLGGYPSPTHRRFKRAEWPDSSAISVRSGWDAIHLREQQKDFGLKIIDSFDIFEADDWEEVVCHI